LWMVGIIGEYTHTTSHVIIEIYVFVVLDFAFKETLVILFSSRMLYFLLSLILDLNFAKLFKGFKDVILIVFHLDRVYDLLYLREDVVVLCLDPCNYFLSPE
jgi:hypothetical protein